MATNDYNAESSGRWDATGSFSDAVTEQRELAFNWASSLDLRKLHWMITIMASDVNAFTLYERKALLEILALKLGREINEEKSMECKNSKGSSRRFS